MKRLLLLGLLGLAACRGATDERGENSGDITDVSPTPAKEQSVPNCWLYAMASWTEAMHDGAAHEEIDLSESYWTYWHWFDQLTSRELAFPGTAAGRIDPTGNWAIAAEIIARRGWMLEGDFLPSENGQVRSQRQWDALRQMNARIAPGGALDTPEKRTAENVLAALDTAFGVSPDTSAKLRAAFGAKGERTFNDGATTFGGLHVASDISVRPGANGEALTLADVLGGSPEPSPGESLIALPRRGPHAWYTSTTAFPSDDASLQYNRGLVKSVQKTLHSHRPVYLFWAMDDTHVDASGTFQSARSPGFVNDAPVKHLSVITDYQVTNVPGFGLLPAGVEETRPEALAAALDDRAVVQFFRIKNPWWGSYDADGHVNPFAASKTGYNDVTLDYLNGEAFQWRRMRQVVLPPDLY